MVRVFMAALLFVSPHVWAEEFSKDTSPEVFQKDYEAMDQIERPFEIGKARLTISTDCQDSKESAESVINKKMAALEDLFKATLANTAPTDKITSEKTDAQGYDLSGMIDASSDNPIANTFDAKKNKFYWTNRCTGVESDVPVRADSVFKASKTITVWLPNSGKVLNDMEALVVKSVALGETVPNGAKVVNASANGAKFALDVGETTEKEAWTEIEKVAKRGAKEKVDLDFAATKYDNVWAGAESFVKNASTQSPNVKVEKENGHWLAKVTESTSRTVYYKQSSEVQSQAGQLVGQKTYSFDATEESKKGLYGSLTVSVIHDCLAAQPKDSNSTTTAGTDIIAQFRALNAGKNTSTDRLEIPSAAVDSHNPALPYYQMNKEGEKVSYYYNPCTLETFDVTQQPELTAWRLTQNLSITSSDLDALSKLRDDLNKKYVVKNNDPSQENVVINWTATASWDVLDSLQSELDRDATEKFLKSGGDFSCDAGKFSFACLSQSNQPRLYGMAAFAAPMDAVGGGQQSGSVAKSDIDASERGVKVFKGKYQISYTLRKVLLDNKR